MYFGVGRRKRAEKRIKTASVNIEIIRTPVTCFSFASVIVICAVRAMFHSYNPPSVALVKGLKDKNDDNHK